jgi:hypothetical protein
MNERGTENAKQPEDQNHNPNRQQRTFRDHGWNLESRVSRHDQRDYPKDQEKKKA